LTLLSVAGEHTRLLALPAELYPHGAETLDFTGFPRYLLLRCEDEIAGCFAGDLLSQLSYTPMEPEALDFTGLPGY